MLFVWHGVVFGRQPPHASRSDNILTHLSVRQLRQPASSSPSASSWSNYKLSEGRGDKFENYEHNSSLDHASDNGTEEAFQIKWNQMKCEWNESEKAEEAPENYSLSFCLPFSSLFPLPLSLCPHLHLHGADLTPDDKLAILRTLGLGIISIFACGRYRKSRPSPSQYFKNANKMHTHTLPHTQMC